MKLFSCKIKLSCTQDNEVSALINHGTAGEFVVAFVQSQTSSEFIKFETGNIV